MSVQLNETYTRNAKLAGVGLSSDGLMGKWKKELSIINEALGGNVAQDKLMNTAILLENTDRHLRSVSQRNAMMTGMRMNEATQTSDVSYFRQFAFNNLMSVIPNLICQDLVSTQPLLSRAGEIRYMRVNYGSDKGKIKAGDNMFSQFNLGDHPYDATYSSDAVEGEFLGTDGATQAFTLSWTPVIPGSLTFRSEDGTVAYRDNNAGKIVSASGSDAGTVNYETGAVNFTTAPVAGVTVDYEYDNLTAPVEVPEINVKIVASPVYAKSRKLKTLYSFDAAFDFATDYAMNLPSEILSLSASQLKREIDDEIVKDLNEKGTAPGVTFNATVPDGVSLVDHYAGFPAALTAASNNLWKLTQVATASWVIAGADAANIIEAIPRFKSLGVVNPKGSYLAGYLGNIPVYKSGAVADDDWTVGYKGDSLFESGYIYAPYLPIMSTQLLMDETFAGRQGYTTSYARKMTNSDFYSRNKITRS